MFVSRLLPALLILATAAWAKDSREAFRAGVGILSWQDSLSLTGPTNEVNALVSSTLGISLGGGYHRELNPIYHLDIELGLVLAQCDAGLPGPLPNQLLYSARNVSAYGGLGSLGLHVAIADAWTLGPSLLVLYKSTAWPQPGAGYTLNAEGPVGLGLVVDARAVRGEWFVDTKVGFFRSVSRFFWSLGLGYSG